MHVFDQISQDPVSEGKTSSGQRCQTDRYTLKPSILASVNVKHPAVKGVKPIVTH